MRGLLSCLMLLISTSAFAGDAILDLTGSGAIVSLSQYGSHSADITAVDYVGSGVDAEVIQKNTGSHTITLDVTNDTGSGGIDVTIVQDSTTDQTLSLTQTCQTTTGCTISVTQQ